MAERFKRLEEITEPDPRNAGFTVVSADGVRRPLVVDDVYRAIEGIVLNAQAPEYIRDHFTTAKHLAVYAWYVYRFHMPAQLQAYASLEYALREGLGFADAERPPGLKSLLATAVSRGLLRRELLRDWPGQGMPPDVVPPHLGEDWLRNLPEWLSYFRNDLAHGSFTLTSDSGRILRLVADIINQLFRDDSA